MSISDTNNAKRYASVAEVAAAQAKIYADKLENAPDYASQAEEAAAQANDSAQSALSAQNGANASAGQAAASANEAAQSASEAESAAGAVFSSSLHAPIGETLTQLPSASGRINTVAIFDSTGDAEVKPLSDFAILDSSGKVPVSMIPAIALTEPFVVNSQASMLALDAQVGDIAKRTDLGYSFVLASAPPSSLANWVQLNDDVLAQLGLPSGANEIGALDDDSNPTTVQGSLNSKVSYQFLASSLASSNVGTNDGQTAQDYINRLCVSDANDYYVGAFFNNNTPDRKITLFKSYNGTWLEGINTTYLQADKNYFLSSSSTALSNTTAVRGDPDITYFNGKWHMSITAGNPNPPIGNPRDLIILVSDDMITWTPKEVKMGPTLLYGQSAVQFGGTLTYINQIWAPALMVTNTGEVWVVATVGINPNAPDIEGVSVTWAAAIGCKCNNLDNLTFDPPQLLLQDISVQRLDPQLHQDLQGRYMIAIKNEYNKHIEIWRSNTVVGGYTKISDLDYGGIPVEGPCLMYSKKYQQWYCYADAFSTLGEYYVVTTSDFNTFSDVIPVRSTEGIRHGTMLNLSMLPDGQQAIASYTRAAVILGQMAPQSPLTSNRGQFTTTGTSNLIPENGMVYRVLGTATRRFYLDDVGTESFFYLAATSDSPAAGIVISGACLVGGIHYVGFGVNNNKLIKVLYDKRNRTYFIEGGYEDPPSTNAVSISTIGNGWPNVTNTWTPQHGLTYTIASAADNTVITGISQPSRDGMYFHVIITNDTAGQITFKSGGSGLAVGGTDKVFTGASNGNRVITVKKIAGAWRILI
ncbi:TPA: hypothetical protein RKX89_000250 [Enterobacter ludwigii]|nr:hypothetical protein [Enterobacter ludwigii]